MVLPQRGHQPTRASTSPTYNEGINLPEIHVGRCHSHCLAPYWTRPKAIACLGHMWNHTRMLLHYSPLVSGFGVPWIANVEHPTEVIQTILIPKCLRVDYSTHDTCQELKGWLLTVEWNRWRRGIAAQGQLQLHQFLPQHHCSVWSLCGTRPRLVPGGCSVSWLVTLLPATYLIGYGP